MCQALVWNCVCNGGRLLYGLRKGDELLVQHVFTRIPQRENRLITASEIFPRIIILLMLIGKVPPLIDFVCRPSRQFPSDETPD